MAKSKISKEGTSTAGQGAASVTVAEPAGSNNQNGAEEIAKLAYSYWLARGCPEGSPEEDWLFSVPRTPWAGGAINELAARPTSPSQRDVSKQWSSIAGLLDSPSSWARDPLAG
jgi:hypothetical protein